MKVQGNVYGTCMSILPDSTPFQADYKTNIEFCTIDTYNNEAVLGMHETW